MKDWFADAVICGIDEHIRDLRANMKRSIAEIDRLRAINSELTGAAKEAAVVLDQWPRIDGGMGARCIDRLLAAIAEAEKGGPP